MNVIVTRSLVLAALVSVFAIGCGGAGTDARAVTNVSSNTAAENHALDRVDHSSSRR